MSEFQPEGHGRNDHSEGAGAAGTVSLVVSARPAPELARFDRRELNAILMLYGRMVASGEWRDYAMDFLKDKAVFSIFRRSCEAPLYRIEKAPKLAGKQGAYAIVAPGGYILKRGHDLAQVLRAIDKPLRSVD